MKAFALSVCPLSLHLDALLCGEDYFPHACLDEAFAILIGIPCLDDAYAHPYISLLMCFAMTHTHHFD